MSLWGELKRRNVFKVGVAYAVMAWVIMQIITLIVPILELPDWTNALILIILLVGLPLACLFAWAFEMTPDGIKRTHEVTEDISITHITGRKIDFLIIGGLVIALAIVIWDSYLAEDMSSGSSGSQTASKPSIAVLPFANMSSDKEQEYFSDGISEEILNLLAKTNGLKVAARTSSFAFKGKNEAITDIGKKLDVNHILEGSVRKSGTTIRITAQLINSDTGYHIWSDTYDRELKDVFAIQDEISAAILVALKLHLLGDNRASAPTSARNYLTTDNMQAYDNYLIGKQMLVRRTEADITKARDFLTKAVELDPDFVPAITHLSLAWQLLEDSGSTYGDIPKTEMEAQVIPLQDKALRLAPDYSDAHAMQGLLHLNIDDKKSLTSLDKAIELNPNNAQAYMWRSSAHQNENRYNDALADIEKAFQLNPMAPVAGYNLVEQYSLVGQVEKAQAIADKVSSLHPGSRHAELSHWIIHYRRGDFDKAIQYIKRATAIDTSGPQTRNYLYLTYISLGIYDRVIQNGGSFSKMRALYLNKNYDEALTLAESIEENRSIYSFALFFQAAIHYDRGNLERAREYLERHYKSRVAKGINLKEACNSYAALLAKKLALEEWLRKSDTACMQDLKALTTLQALGPDLQNDLVELYLLFDRQDDAIAELKKMLAGGYAANDLDVKITYGDLHGMPAFEAYRTENDAYLKAMRDRFMAGETTD